MKRLIKSALKKAMSHLRNGDPIQSSELYKQILRVDPNCKEARQMLPLSLVDISKEEAIESINEIDITDYQSLNNIGLIYSKCGQTLRAENCFRAAIFLNPQESFLWTNLALEYKKQKKWVESLRVMEMSSRIFINNEYAWFNYGSIYHEMGFIEKAIECYLKSIELNNNFPSSHYNLSDCYLSIGNYKQGWEEYEWRWKNFQNFSKVRQKIKKPYWNGEDLTDKVLLLYCEQGIGDTIMFSRYINRIKAKKIILVCPKFLHSLFSSFNVVENFKHQRFDYQCSLMSLAGIFNETIDSINGSPYLFAKKSGNWSNYNDKLKVGICWAGNPVYPKDRTRSCHLKYFDFKDCYLFSLQYDTRPRKHGDEVIDLTEGFGRKLITFDKDVMQDFGNLASIIMNLDVVVTVDTSIVHLCGAIGKKCFLVVSKDCSWRWSGNWYDSVTIFKQNKLGEWGEVFDRVIASLKHNYFRQSN